MAASFLSGGPRVASRALDGVVKQDQRSGMGGGGLCPTGRPPRGGDLGLRLKRSLSGGGIKTLPLVLSLVKKKKLKGHYITFWWGVRVVGGEWWGSLSVGGPGNEGGF